MDNINVKQKGVSWSHDLWKNELEN